MWPTWATWLLAKVKTFKLGKRYMKEVQYVPAKTEEVDLGSTSSVLEFM